MSGIGGVVELGGRPVERALLERMAQRLVARGPHGRGVWVDGSVGLVHTLLCVSDEDGPQPIGREGELWIVADARLDARQELVRALVARGQDCSVEQSDAELLLAAYAAWGTGAVEHLLGDFAFAIWDGRRRRLFCARDQFGIKPFYYALAADRLLFASHPDPLLADPAVDADPYDPVIADFLVLGFNHDAERTAHAGVFRLPPAHRLVVEDGRVEASRYWSLPVVAPTRLRRWEEVTEQFLELFERAVADRLRGRRFAVLLSGGLDSGSVAAMAQRVLARRGDTLRAHVAIYEELIPYREDHYAAQTARALGIPLHIFKLDPYRLMEHWDRPEFREPEPELVRIFDRRLADTLDHPEPGTVVLSGQGGDGLFSSRRLRHCRERLQQGQWLQLGVDLARYLVSPRRWQRLYLGVHWAMWRRQLPARRPFPEWIQPELVRRFDLRERYEQNLPPATRQPAPLAGAVRPEAHWLLQSPVWPALFVEVQPEYAGAAVEVRYPFFDLRLMEFVLSLPALPWCSDKELLRRAMRGYLPDAVRWRRKTPVAVDHLRAHWQRDPRPWLEAFQPEPGLERYVNVRRFQQCLMQLQEGETVVQLRPIMLNLWLKWDAAFIEAWRKEEVRVET